MRQSGSLRRRPALLGSTALFAAATLGAMPASAQTTPSDAPAASAPLSPSPVASSPSAAASSPPLSSSSQPANSGDIADIVVTATKRVERLQDVPISVQVLGEEKLNEHQTTNIDDYVRLLPSVSYQSYGPGQSQLFFRGITSGGDGGTGAHGGSPPTSGLYVDEVPLTTIGDTVDLHIYDVNRVEALSGPQGTLFGASSLAGTLRIITNQPDPRAFSAGYQVQGDKYGGGTAGYITQGFVNVPISDKVAVRLVAFDEHDGGYINNVLSQRTYTLGDTDPSNDITVNNARFVKSRFNDIDTVGGRAALRIDLDDDWSITPALIYQNQTANGAFLYDPAEGNLNVNDYQPDKNTDRWYQAALTIKGKIADWDMTYAFGYFGRVVENQADYSYYSVFYDKIPGYTKFPNGQGGYLDPTQFFRGKDDYTKHTQELRFSSPADRRVRALVGAFYQRQTDEIHADYGINGLSGIPNSPAVPTFGDSIFASHLFRTDRDYAAFGEVAVDILPNVTLTGGFRGFIADNTQFGFSGFLSNTQTAACVATARTDLPCVNVNRGVYETGETHKINLAWKIDPNHLVYFTYSTGFRPGGINRRPAIGNYAPDTLTNYEIGAKTSWLGQRLFIDGAAFIEDWNQLQYGLPSIGSAGVISIYNAGNAEVKGAEGEVTWHATRQLTLSGSGTYIDAHLTTNFCAFNAAGQVDCANGIAAPKGTQLPIQPRWKLNGTARDQFQLGDYDAFVQAAALFQSSTRSWLTDREAALLGSTGDFATVDFSAGIIKGNWRAEAFIQNAFDRRGELSINTVCVPTICGGRPRIYPVKPQFFGVKFEQLF